MEKFKIPAIPPTTNKSIHFPNNVIKEVEQVIQGKNCIFTAFVAESVGISLKNSDENRNIKI